MVFCSFLISYQEFSRFHAAESIALPHNNCYWTSLLRSDEKFYGLTGIFNYPKAMPSEGWVGWAEPKTAHNGDRNYEVAFFSPLISKFGFPTTTLH